ncbi:MAG: murein biosynthesis integral membrane protein MurJ [Verrucomicrobia bacterium]|jgi:putative peptidoglycan lipid II flippase|nr:murein biosynthesis integral membrane protein MurJ [Verrucomicrobiota bacterium]
MAGLGKRISEVAGWTMISRLLGLLRDILLFASLGTGILNSAFLLAFTLPNLFRRLLGEGALSSSAIPVLAECRELRGPASTHELLNALLVRLGAILGGLVLLALPLLSLVATFEGLPERWYAGAALSQLLFPYVMLICLGALICGTLNVFGRFGLASANQIWLNLMMIGALLAGMGIWPADGEQRVLWLSLGVLAGGMLQLLVPAWGMARAGWRFPSGWRSHPDLGKVLRLFLPGLLGAAIFQLNILVSRLLAFSLNDTATGLLYIASRLVELPLGVFAIAVTTVAFPELSRLASAGKAKAFARTYHQSLGLILLITLPAAVGLALLGESILSVLFEWGLFGGEDVKAAYPVLVAAAAGLPFFAWSTLLTRSYYARQRMRIPVILAAVNLFLNLLLGLLLMQWIGATGLALANTLAAAVHCTALQVLGGRMVHLAGMEILRRSLRESLRVGVALGMLGIVCGLGRLAPFHMALEEKTAHVVVTLLVLPLAAAVYFLALHLQGLPALRLLSGMRKSARD